MPKSETKTLSPVRLSHTQALHGPKSLDVARELLMRCIGAPVGMGPGRGLNLKQKP